LTDLLRPARRMGARLAVVLLGALVTVAGCAGKRQPDAGPVIDDPGIRPTATPSPVRSGPRAPLTGAETTAAADRRAVSVSIRAGSGGPAPAGLDAADLVYQEFAEGGSLRLMALYQSRDAGRVGPVTEIRPADIKTLTVYRPFVGYASAPQNFANQLANSQLPAVSRAQRGDLFPGGYTSTATLHQAAPAGTAPPGPFLFGGAGVPLAQQGVSRAERLTVAVPGYAPQVWQYDQGADAWRTTVAGTPVAVTSVVVLTMPYQPVEVRHPSFRQMPSAKVIGEGAALTVSGPNAAPGRWRKPSADQLCNVVDAIGDQIRPHPGATWVVYAPEGAAVSTA
jgi:hypothetical protein